MVLLATIGKIECRLYGKDVYQSRENMLKKIKRGGGIVPEATGILNTGMR